MAYLSVAVDIQVISTWDSIVYRVPTTFVCRINAAEIPRLGESIDTIRDGYETLTGYHTNGLY